MWNSMCDRCCSSRRILSSISSVEHQVIRKCMYSPQSISLTEINVHDSTSHIELDITQPSKISEKPGGRLANCMKTTARASTASVFVNHPGKNYWRHVFSFRCLDCILNSHIASLNYPLRLLCSFSCCYGTLTS